MTEPRPRHLRGLSAAGRAAITYRCQVATQANLQGTQDTRVQAATPLAGPGHGYITIRIGRVLIYLEDRDALDSVLDAARQAETLADKAFGPVLPPPAYRPHK